MNLTEQGELGEKVVLVKSTCIGEKIERMTVCVDLQSLHHGGVGRENITPDALEFVWCALKADGGHGLLDESFVIHLPIFKRDFELVEVIENMIFGVVTKGSKAACCDAEVEADNDVADVAKDGWMGHKGDYRC